MEHSKKPHNLSVKITDTEKKEVEKILSLHKERHPDETISTYLRGVLQSEGQLWLKSPYISTNCKIFLFVSRDGSFHYWRSDELLVMQDKVSFIPASVSMKNSKIDQYLADFNLSSELEKSSGFQNYLKNKWIYNHFAFSFWTARDKKEQKKMTDLEGATYKKATFEEIFSDNATIVREISVGLSQYCRWVEPNKPSTPAYLKECLENDILLPTLKSEIVVLIDPEIYRATPEHKVPKEKMISIRIGNLESPPDQNGRELPAGSTSNHIRLLDPNFLSGNSKLSPEPSDSESIKFIRYCLQSFGEIESEFFPKISVPTFAYHLLLGPTRPGTLVSLQWDRPQKPSEP